MWLIPTSMLHHHGSLLTDSKWRENILCQGFVMILASFDIWLAQIKRIPALLFLKAISQCVFKCFRNVGDAQRRQLIKSLSERWNLQAFTNVALCYALNSRSWTTEMIAISKSVYIVDCSFQINICWMSWAL